MAGLHSVLSSLLQLPATVVPAGERTKWSTLLEIVPPIPMTNATPPAIAPGEKLPPKTSNVENPELYTLHPYRVYSAAKGVPEAALLAYRNKRFPKDDGWCQVAPDAALAGRLCSQPICSFASASCRDCTPWSYRIACRLLSGDGVVAGVKLLQLLWSRQPQGLGTDQQRTRPQRLC